ncbi:hypothetical protein [Planctomyces sp. SH-PL62]|uniref:hypothetical protein n=1 Tax=Planctomyces sp. SH-PL62 TaxID=1636152 RepID=UPI00078C2B62|nr:hypothetical protein [Planctomyces sp. SH-PL62]AMV37737.1 hypothetical protein VT85_09895 [Planctomyces sp. SH-PL62]
MDIDAIERRLAAAREREQAVYQNMDPANRDRTWEDDLAAAEAVLQAERELAAAKGEEHAVPLDFPVHWNLGVPTPHVLQSDRKTFLIFRLDEQDPDWDGTYVRLVDPGDGSIVPLALVEFLDCSSARLGDPNNEVHEGHPLNGRGLDGYMPQRVVNSRWLTELEAINRVHPCYDQARWRDRNHYVFWFCNSTFECVARSFTVETFRESFADLLARACRRLLS